MAQKTQQDRQWADRGWYLVLEFGHSNSDRYDEAVRLARRGPGYLALLDENRALIHRNLYRGDDLRHFWRLLERVRTWKSSRLFTCGDPVTADEATPGVQCHLFFRKPSFCRSKWRDWPMFIGCPNLSLSLDPSLGTAWFRRAYRSGRIFRLDKGWLSERLEFTLQYYRCCPQVRPEPARELLRRLPDEIDAAQDRRWRVERDTSARPASGGVRPASDEAYAEYLREIFRGVMVAGEAR